MKPSEGVVLSDHAVVEYAASRYGRRNPSFDDVLDRRFPRYNQDDIHTKGWHRLQTLAFKIVLARGLKRECSVCGVELVARGRNVRYCSRKCVSLAGHGGTLRSRNAKQGPFSVEERDQICELYLAGKTTIEVAYEVNRSPSGVTSVLRSAGVKMRPTGPRPAKDRRAA